MPQNLVVQVCGLSSFGKANTDMTSTTGKPCMHLCIDLQPRLWQVCIFACHAVDKLQTTCECTSVCGASREAAARERLAMLKSNDVGAYLKLVQSAKNSRISQLLNQTDACLNKLAARLNLKSSAQGSRGVASAGTAGTDGK